MSTPAVDIVVVSFNTAALLRACLDSVAAHAPGARVIVVDNASGDGSAALVREAHPRAMCLALEENIGFGAANNRGIAAGDAPYVLCLNSDAALTPGALERLVGCLETRLDAVIAGPRLAYPDGRFQPSCRRFPTLARNFWCYSGLQGRLPGRVPALENWLDEAAHARAGAVDMVSGACFLMRRTWIESLGGFDENLFLYEEETDISLPARRRGHEVYYCPEALVYHHGGASVDAGALSAFSMRHLFRSKYVCFRKHHGALYAALTHAVDVAVFGQTALRRGPSSEAAATLRIIRRAWRESHEGVAQLRARGALFGN
jgi:GT2 family glycosyltransferase